MPMTFEEMRRKAIADGTLPPASGIAPPEPEPKPLTVKVGDYVLIPAGEQIWADLEGEITYVDEKADLVLVSIHTSANLSLADVRAWVKQP